MMFDSQAHFGQQGVASPFAQQALLATLPIQFGQAIGQAIGQSIAACLGQQLVGGMGQPGRLLPLEATLGPMAFGQHGLFPGMPGAFGQSHQGGWGQPYGVPPQVLHGLMQQGLFGGLGTPQTLFGQGIPGLGSQYVQPGIGSWINPAQLAAIAPQVLLGGQYGPQLGGAIGGWPGQTQLGQFGGLQGRGFGPYQQFTPYQQIAPQLAYAG